MIDFPEGKPRNFLFVRGPRREHLRQAANEVFVNVSIRLPHRPDAPPVRDHAERVLRFAFTRFTDAIVAIRLRLVDENGPRGGVDQRCRVQVELRDGGKVRVEGTGSDAHAVIHAVVSRVARATARHLGRSRKPRLG